MPNSFHGKILKDKGFQRMAEITWGYSGEFWWHESDLIQVSDIIIPPVRLVKASKPYLITAITRDGETYVRDLNQLQNFLGSRFPQFHMTLVYYRDPPEEVILKRIRQIKMRNTGRTDIPDIATMEAELETKLSDFNSTKDQIAQSETIMQKGSSGFELFERFMKFNIRKQKQQLEKSAHEGRKLERVIGETKSLKTAYKKSTAAVALLFTYSSNIQIASDSEEYQDALENVIKEVLDAHHFEIQQRLNGSRLSVYVEELKHPGIVLQAEWNGFLNPHQLRKAGEPLVELRDQFVEIMETYPVRDITVNGATKDQKKLVAAKVVQNFLGMLDVIDPSPPILDLPKKGRPVGMIMQGDQITDIPLLMPTEKGHHCESGMTTGGKSNTGRVFGENYVMDGCTLVAVDPTRQWCGFGLPCDKESALERYDQLGISRENACGFPIKIYDPSEGGVGLPLPDNLDEIFDHNSVVTVKEHTEKGRCAILTQILKAVCDSFNYETDDVRLVLVIEETHTFLQKKVGKNAKEEAKEVERLIEKIVREKAKYGVVVILVTQSQGDLSHEARAVRDQITTRSVHRSSDIREKEYLSNYGLKDDLDNIRKLRSGEALIVNYDHFREAVKVFVRPPFSTVREVTDEEIRSINGTRETQQKVIKPILQNDDKENEILDLVKAYWNEHHDVIFADEIQRQLKLSTGTRQRTLDRMFKKGLIKRVSVKIGRGRPKIGIKPVV
jgi:hypothetical protein